LTSHPSADEVFQRVRRKLPRISLGTVYRNLEELSEQDLILKLETAGAKKRFDGNTEAHYHLRCLGCGQIVDLPLPPIGALDDMSFKDLDGCQVIGHHLEFYGYCQACRAAREKEEGGKADGD